MANSDKQILITPNIGSSVDDPKIVFSGASDTLGPQNITVAIYPAENGTLSFEGSAGQLFSISNSLSGTIFSANDVSGIPSIEVLDTGLIKLAQYSGNVLIGTGVDNGSKLQVAGVSSFGTDAANYLTVSGAATGNPVAIGTDGTDTNIGFQITTKGTGAIVLDTGVGAGQIDLKPGASNVRIWDDDSSHYWNISTGNIAANYTLTLPAGNVILTVGTMVPTTGTGATGTWSINVTGNAATASVLQTSRTIGGVSFNGSVNIDLPGVNTTGNQNTTGSASTLTTARTIAMTGDVSYTSAAFNGSTNVTGTATLASVGTAGTYAKVTTDVKGRVTSGTTLVAADIPSLDASKFTTGIVSTARLGSGTANTTTWLRGDGTWQIGPIGYTGSQGPIGYTGSQGPQGTTGFTGSQGPQGPIGYTGSRGATGFTGSQGPIGYTGSSGAGSSVTTQDTPPVSPAAGDLWWDSTIGQLRVYYNDENSSQWVDAVNAQGLQGITGFTGSQGITGFTGSQGTIGYTGSQGVLGYVGSRGYTGSQGQLGFTGSQGAGFTGSKGDTGFTGSSGAYAAVGFTGSKGDPGDVTTGKAIAMAIVFG